MIRTGEEYKALLQDGREVYISEQVLQKKNTSVTGPGAFLGTTATAVKA